MATPGHGKSSVHFYDGFRLSQIISKAKHDYKVGSAEVTALEDAEQVHLQGKLGGTVSKAGFLDVAVGGWDSLAFAGVTDGNHVLTTCPTGIAASSIALLEVGLSNSQSRAFDQGGAVMLDWSGVLTGYISRGKVLTTSTAVTATAAQAGINIGTTSATQTLVAHVLLLAASGTGSITVVTQESSDNGSGDAYATISGMTSTLTTVGTAFRQTFTGATETWKRSNVTAFSGFTSATILVAIGTAAQ